ncbi:alginate O-acetyltransferase AlgX-related protein [Phenylobacterium immobile]|uniref:alginate O-acetyltransferase AlgX-related protein n=1 Tax=Phenylobacterium immobile TaxID=21 RepID=UPI000A7FC1D3|nr:hypothetical protein [Phenylobacterium immobile]
MIASKTHWRLLVGGVIVLMAAATAPLSHLPQPVIQENRKLSERPRWSGGYEGLKPFRKATDAYIADHFPARPYLIAALNRVRMMAGVSGSPKVIVGRKGWLFYDDGSHMGGVRADPPWGQIRTRDWLATLAGRTEALRARGIAYVVFVAPLKETVYPQFGPWWLKGAAPDHAALRMPPIVEASGAGVLVSPSKALDAAREAGDPVYSRHDTHWTGYGAYVGYVALMDRLHAMGLTEGPRPRSDFPPAAPLPLKATPHDLAKMLGVGGAVDVQYPELVDRGDLKRAKVVWLTPIKHWSKPHIIETGVSGKPILLMTVDSFSNELLPFMYRHFSRIIVVHNEEGTWREDLIDRYRPDIVILEVVEGGLKFSLTGGPAPSPAARARIETALPNEATGLPELQRARASEAGATRSAKLTDQCNVERVELRPVVPGISHGQWLLDVGGWLVGGARDGFLRISGPGGDLTGAVDFGLQRPDVGEAFREPRMSESGFDQTFVIKGATPGQYKLSFYRRAGALGGWRECRASQPYAIPANSP